jgi:hypothetical protein
MGSPSTASSAQPASPIPIRKDSVTQATSFRRQSTINEQGHSPRSSSLTKTIGNSSAFAAAVGANGPQINLACPICGQRQANLLALNNHLDDEHSEDADTDALDGIRNWFRGKFMGGISSGLGAVGVDKVAQRVVRTLANEPDPEPDDGITRTHWQHDADAMACTFVGCQRLLAGRGSGRVHCRRCGKLFCDVHCGGMGLGPAVATNAAGVVTSSIELTPGTLMMRLSRQAKHDPDNGIWAPVCEACFASKPGYNDTEGPSSDWMDDFTTVRRKAVDRADLARNRLEKRLDKAGSLHSFDSGVADAHPCRRN